MPSIGDITTGASYRGDAALGGYAPTAISIDTSPIEKLAQFTFLTHKSEYEQRQKDADEKIAELSALTPYDLVNGLPKDKDELISAQAALTKYMAEHAAKGTPKSPQEKIEQEVEFKTKIQEQIKKINGANARLISYNVQKNAIEGDNTLSAVQKDNLLNDLQTQANTTDIYTPIQALPKYKAPNIDVGTPNMRETGILKLTPNGYVEEKIKIFDAKTTRSNSYLIGNGLSIPTLPENATPQQKEEYRQRILNGDTNTIWQLAEQNYGKALSDPKYSKTVIDPITGTASSINEIDPEKIKANNPILGDIISLADRWNKYATKMRADAAEYYTDSVGNHVKLLKAVDPDDYQLIDTTKPISAGDLVFLQQFAKAVPDKVEKDYKYTGAAITRENNLLDYQAAIFQKLKNGTANKDEKSQYPILKTQELVNSIGINTNPVNINTLTPEQQEKIKSQVGNKINIENSTISIKDGKIIISSKGLLNFGGKTVSINPDDITKSYYDEINKNDTGKEAPERRYFSISATSTASQAGQNKNNAQPFTAKMPDGTIITSTDGQNWFDKKGNKVE